MRERRFLTNEFRASGTPANPKISGYAATFNVETELQPGLWEVIRPGAFKQSIAKRDDCGCFFNHDESLILGRVSAGTLRLKEDSKGLFFDCDVDAEVSYAADLYRNIKAGNISECSFGFYTIQDDYTKTKQGVLRELLTAKVFDVSPVTFPAYSQTSVAARSLFPDGMPAALELRMKEARDFDGLGGPVPFARCAGALRDADFDEEDIVSGMVDWSSEEDEQGERSSSSSKKLNREKLSQGFAYVDGDGSNVADYKLPHHVVVDGQLQHIQAGARKAWRDFQSGAVKIPAEHCTAVRNHLRSELALFDTATDVTTGSNPDLAPMGVILDSRSALDDARRRLAVAKLKF
jgi:HK97 family phage prohead protease